MASNNPNPNDNIDKEEDNDCPVCHGSGGGSDVALRCPACCGSGVRDRKRYVSDDPDDYDPDYIARRFGR